MADITITGSGVVRDTLVIRAVDHGADPTGVTPTDVNALIALLPTAGGRIYFDVGTYLLTGTPVVMKSRVTLDGDSTWSVEGHLGTQAFLLASTQVAFVQPNGANCDMVQFPATCIGARVRGIALAGNKANQSSGNGVRYIGAGSPPRGGNWLERVHIAQVHDTGVVVDSNHYEARMREVLVIESGSDGYHVGGNDCYLSLCLAGYSGGNGFVFDGNSFSTTVEAIDSFDNTLAGVYVNGVNNLRPVNWQCNRNKQEGVRLNNANYFQLVGGYMLDNGQEFSTTATRYADVRITSSSSHNAGIGFIGVMFASTAGIQSWAIINNESTPAPHDLIGCTFTGTYNSGYVTPSRTFHAAGCYNLANTVRPVDAATIGEVIKGAASQTADLLQLQDSTGKVGGRFGPTGRYEGAQTTYLRSGSYLAPAALTTTGTIANGFEFAVPLVVGGSGTLSEIGIEVTTNGEAGAKIRLGIRADDGNGYPLNGAPLVDAGQVAGDATGYQSAVISLAVTPGLYWLTATTQSVVTTAPTVRTLNGAMPQVMATSGLAAISAARSAYRQSGVTGALPSTFSATVDPQGGGPRIAVKVS